MTVPCDQHKLSTLYGDEEPFLLIRYDYLCTENNTTTRDTGDPVHKELPRRVAGEADQAGLSCDAQALNPTPVSRSPIRLCAASDLLQAPTLSALRTAGAGAGSCFRYTGREGHKLSLGGHEGHRAPALRTA